MLRLFLIILIPVGALLAQEPASPTPAPEASPSPTPVPAPAASPEPSLAPAASPAGEADVIPLEGGAPLETRDIAPTSEEEVMPGEPSTQPEALIPEEAPSRPPAVTPAFESAQERARQVSIRYREVRVQAEKDPKVISLLEQAEQARTLEDQRAAMREYYRLLFRKIVAIDKSLEEKCRVLETAYIRRLAQERLEPTIPLKPPPTPEPLN